ncbi:MAG TPA: methionine--tRNA ligase subunit beta [Candidatus Paceibacterota bacterium]
MNTENTNTTNAESEVPAAGVPEESAQPMSAPVYASIDDFVKIEMKIGKVLEAVPVEGSEKLLKLKVDFAEAEPRQVLSGIAKFVTPEDLIGNSFPFVTNLKPRPMMGLESQAMILAVNDDQNFALLKPTAEIKAGTSLK